MTQGDDGRIAEDGDENDGRDEDKAGDEDKDEDGDGHIERPMTDGRRPRPPALVPRAAALALPLPLPLMLLSLPLPLVSAVRWCGAARLPLIHPEGWLRTWWLATLLLASLITTVTLPARLGFGNLDLATDLATDGFRGASTALDLACDAVFIVSLMASFLLPYYDADARLETRPRAIARRHAATGMLLIDLLAAMPLVLCAATRYERPALRAPLLVQIARTPWLVDALWRRLTGSTPLVDGGERADLSFSARKLAVISYSFALIAHLCACTYGGVQRLQRGDEAPRGAFAYLQALWWAVTVLTAHGSTLTPSSELELAFASLVYALSLVTTIVLIGQLTVLISNLDAIAVTFRKRRDAADAFVRKQGIPGGLARRLHLYQRVSWTHGAGSSLEVVVQQLSPSIRSDIMKHICTSQFARLPLFEGCGPAFIEALYSAIRLEVFPRDEWICRKGSVSAALYIVLSGSVAVVIDEALNVVIAKLNRGDFFGERALFAAGETRNASVLARTTVELVELQAGNFRKVLESWPEVEAQMLAAKNARESETTAIQALRASSSAASLRASRQRYGGRRPNDTTEADVQAAAAASNLHQQQQHLPRDCSPLRLSRQLASDGAGTP